MKTSVRSCMKLHLPRTSKFNTYDEQIILFFPGINTP
jgi:hypothetical protein